MLMAQKITTLTGLQLFSLEHQILPASKHGVMIPPFDTLPVMLTKMQVTLILHKSERGIEMIHDLPMITQVLGQMLVPSNLTVRTKLAPHRDDSEALYLLQP